ncbi:MAG: sulfur carrier protein ThiS [Acidobacteria bacterium]|nr:sulfur carrier protein ThiS [Acidobacteriota bacterium]
MITGFNTDIEHEGVVYHVQTEDKGLDTPFILSLVYVGGAILASKRSPYTDLLNEGFDADALNERLQRQHKLICAAITSGRIEELKRLNQRENEALSAGGKGARRRAGKPAPDSPQATAPPPPPAVKSRPPRKEVREDLPTPTPPQVEATPEAAVPVPFEDVVVPVEAEQEAAPVAAQPIDVHPETPEPERDLIPVEIDGELYVNLLEERDYRAGEIVTLRVRVSRGPIESREAVNDAAVTVKVLGTEFRPLILTSREVVRRALWEETALAEGDRIEVVHFVGGGCGHPGSRALTPARGSQNPDPDPDV